MNSEILVCFSPIIAFIALIFLGFVIWRLMDAASVADDIYGDDQYEDK